MPAVTDTEAGAGASVQSVDRALTILELLAREGDAGVTEIAAELGVHKSTAFRLLATLEAHRLVEQEGERGRYRLGGGNLRLGGGAAGPLRPGRGGRAGGPPPPGPTPGAGQTPPRDADHAPP